MNNVRIAELRPKVAEMARLFLAKCKEQGIDLLITCGYRSPEEQDRLYQQGRTTPGAIVTNAKAGESYHQYRCAIDVVPLIGGKPLWTSTYEKTSKIGKECGFFWGGDFEGNFKDKPHFQYTGGYSLQDFQQNKVDWTRFDLLKTPIPDDKFARLLAYFKKLGK